MSLVWMLLLLEEALEEVVDNRKHIVQMETLEEAEAEAAGVDILRMSP